MPPSEPAPAAARTGSTRARPRTLIAIAALLLVARIVLGIADRREPESRADLVQWRSPGASATAEAGATGKPILYDFMAEWCGPCHVMQGEVFANPKVAAQINATYVPVRVVDRQREEGRNIPEVDSLQQRFQIEAFPTLVVASPDGAKFDVQQGYAGRAETAQWLSEAPRKVMGGAR